MTWSVEQRRRLATEHAVLARYFPSLTWRDPTGLAYITGDLRSNVGSVYTVRIQLGADFPESVPVACISRPRPLRTLDGYSFASASALMHSLGLDAEGNVVICHYNSERWTSNCTLYKVAMKVRIWLEAYEGHLRTGEPIDHFLKHMST
jgi:hypothetical protein